MDRVVWFYWSQGWDQAPWFVKRNYLSWVVNNPSWKIVFLDESNISHYSDAVRIVERNKDNISITAFSDVLRLDLLARFGGAWVDATILCVSPLESWLPDVVEPSGFFSFRSGCVDRDLASWHLAAKAGNYLVRRWLDETIWYWGDNRFDHPHPWWPVVSELQTKYCVSLEATEGFFSDEVLKEIRVYPYFWVNYLHQRLVRVDAAAAEVWDKTPYVHCGPQSIFLEQDPLAPLNDFTRDYAFRSDPLMFKFDRRRMPEVPPEGSAMEMLYRPVMGLGLPAASEIVVGV